MNFKSSICNPLERKDWDSFVARFAQSTFFHSSAWLHVLHDTYRYQPVAIQISNQADDEAASVLMEVDSLLTGKRGVSLPFTDELSPLYTRAECIKALNDQVYDVASKRSWKYTDLRSDAGFGPETPPSTRYFSHTLALGESPSRLFENFSPSTRRAIRKAESSHLSIERSEILDSVEKFYELVCLTRKRQGLPPQPWKFFANIHRRILSAGKGTLFLAKHESQPIAGALFFHTEKQAIYKFGASDARFQAQRPNNLIMWEAIKQYAEGHYETLNFGRTSLTNEGLRRFKLGWGATESTLSYFKRSTQTQSFMPMRDQTTGWHTRFFKQMPVPFLKIAGSLLYRHIG